MEAKCHEKANKICTKSRAINIKQPLSTQRKCSNEQKRQSTEKTYVEVDAVNNGANCVHTPLVAMCVKGHTATKGRSETRESEKTDTANENNSDEQKTIRTNGQQRHKERAPKDQTNKQFPT
jgi:hypothetical protein